uniref:Uncharacterized protein n=1 Tax=Aegilops tauschii subsp. strangulata TaxID=200361 RepID=A0A453AAX2_AEGTS
LSALWGAAASGPIYNFVKNWGPGAPWIINPAHLVVLLAASMGIASGGDSFDQHRWRSRQHRGVPLWDFHVPVNWYKTQLTKESCDSPRARISRSEICTCQLG